MKPVTWLVQAGGHPLVTVPVLYPLPGWDGARLECIEQALTQTPVLTHTGGAALGKNARYKRNKKLKALLRKPKPKKPPHALRGVGGQFVADEDKMLEKTIKYALKDYLKEIGAYKFMPVPTGFGADSIDFLVCYKGMFFGIETKRTGVTEPTDRQRATMDRIEAAGGKCWVENSADLETTRLVLDNLQRLV